MFYTIAILISIVMQAFFTASEMAFTAVDRVRLRGLVEGGDRAAIRLENFLKKEGDYLGITLVGTNICVVMTSALATRIFMGYFDVQTAPVMVTLIVVPITLIFAEILPKMIARQFSTSLAMRIVVPLSGFHQILYPLVVVVNFIARGILKPFGKFRRSWDLKLTKNDLKRILMLGHETGDVEANEVELIHKVLDFRGKKVEKIMVPLYRVSSISDLDTVRMLKDLVRDTDYSRIPVYHGYKNNIVGIINVYDIIFEKGDVEETDAITKFMREPVSVNEDDGLNIALTRLRRKKQPMGIVLDGKGEAAGIVTMEDMFEEIVGEIEDTGGV